ncbi:MAG: ATP-binding protein, partial [Saprospiraceae bacterium]|nr:ATP-binding protein [Saprospiraceae bacterium]MCB0627181.1 ATP-binding protein [Saprospiraceae bacterium]
DRVARDLAVSFYEQLSKGKSLQSAFSAYESRHLLSQTPYDELIREDARGLQLRAQEPFPWKMHVRAGAEAVLDWTLAVEAGNPLFGLPPLPQRYHLPADPFRGLERFQREHAAVFFGRGKEIRMLYDKISNAQLNPVILLYGQSGVGKSSLLEAGLIPRLEDQFRVRSLRRDPEEGISTGFRALLDPQSEHASLRDSWQAQSTGRKPLVVVLDQVEEIFTRPVSGDERELQSLVGQLRDLFDGSSPALPGKLLLSYRKEYHPEIEAALREAGVPFTKVFLDKIRKPGIVEAVTGLT